jgi:Fe2+-dicitrate sensor, membrane component
MSKDRIWLLVSKKLAGEANTEELMELEDLLRHDPDMHYALENIAGLWNLPNQHSIETEEAFDRHTSRMKANGVSWPEPGTATTGEPFLQHRSYNTLWFTGIAAALLLIAGIIWWYPGAKQPTTNPVAKTPNEKNEISTRNGSKTKITLPDGSKVWLNAGSKLVYNKEFGNNVREVELSGEAFFDVVHVTAPQNGEKIPFIIHTKQLDIRVLGTAFNVKSYPGESITETSLVRGKVEIVIHNRPDEKIILKPNEKLMVRNDEPVPVKEDSVTTQPDNKPPPLVSLSKLTPREDSLIVETAWVQNKLVFDNESFNDVAAKMERWYNVQFKFKEARLQKLRFSGVFESETIQQALDYMSITGPFHYSMQGNMIYIGR